MIKYLGKRRGAAAAARERALARARLGSELWLDWAATNGDGGGRKGEHRLPGVAGLRVGGGRDRKGGRRRRQERYGRTAASSPERRPQRPRRRSGGTATVGKTPVRGGGPQEGNWVVRRRQGAEVAALARALARARLGSERGHGRTATDGDAGGRGREHRTVEVEGRRKVSIRDTKR